MFFELLKGGFVFILKFIDLGSFRLISFVFFKLRFFRIRVLKLFRVEFLL